MQKNTGIIAVLLILTILGGVFSYAWLGDNGMLAAIGVTSHVHKSYFESGDGTSHIQYQTYDENGNPIIGTDENGNELDSSEGCAFEIRYPVQLYYFAWLQYFGYFNQPIEGTNEINQVYFYLSADLDMYGWVLPPIGTKEYPFVGNFDGNGHTIANLTIKNQTGLTDDPVNATLSNTEIVGFFGVVGSLNTDDRNPDYGKVNGAIDNNGVMTAVAGYSYDTSINEIKNFNLTGTTKITTETDKSLIGIVAGYVNGKIENVRVGSTSIIRSVATSAIMEDYTTNLSDYTLMGYVTETYKDTSDVAVVDIATPTFASSQFTYTAQGASAGWGGSIDMYDLYQRLINARTVNQSITSGNEYITLETHVYDAYGNEILTPLYSYGSNDTNYRKYTSSTNYLNGSGSYLFRNSDSTTQYNYLTTLYKTVRKVVVTNNTEDAFYIRLGTTYLNLNASKNGITTTGTNTKWVYDNGYIRTTDDYGYIYYLNWNGSSFSIGTSGTTSWSVINNTAISCSAGYINYVGNAWTLTPLYYYTIQSGAQYLNATGSTDNVSIGTGTSITGNTPTHWYFTNPGSGNNGTIYTFVNGTRYYLCDAISNNSSLRITNSTSSATVWYWTTSRSFARLRAGTTLSARYVYFNNTQWVGRTTAFNLTITQHDEQSPNLDLDQTNVPVYSVTEKEVPSIFSALPLSASPNAPFNVNTGNTGYIVSGSHTQQSPNGDIRVSRYTISNNISNSYSSTSKRLTTVYTIDAGGLKTITDSNAGSFQQYMKSKEKFLDVLALDSSNVYGLHFMDAAVNINNIVTLKTALVFDKLKTDYEMPEDCIDFKVFQKGYINFFAGTYFSLNNVDNSSFFSLNIIERDDNDKITAIKEVKEVWVSSDQSKDYIYYLKDGNSYEWSATKTSDYSLAFDTDWITQPGNDLKMRYIYYFEIPVNAGEFALGSVDGSSGAYLLYLDIAANAQLVNRAAITEKFNETTYTYKYPTGATFTNDFFTELTSPIAPAFAGLMKTTNTFISVTVDQYNDDILTVTGIDNENDVYYVKDGKKVTLTGTPGQPILTGGKPSKTTSVKIQRTTYYDYNIALDRYTITEVVAISSYNNGTASTTFTINAWQATYNNGTWEKGTQIATNVTFSSPATLMEYHDAVGGIPAFYLYKVGPGENDETLRFDADVFKQIDWTYISPYRNKLWYAVKDNSETTITYAYNNTVIISTTSAGTGTSFNDNTGLYIVNIDATGSGEVRVEGARCTAIN